MWTRAGRIRLKLGLETVLGLRHSGFFIPYRHAGNTRALAQHPYAALEPVFKAAEADFVRLIAAIDGLADDIESITGLEPPEPRFEQDWFARLDAAAHYTLVRTRKPKRIIEVGSGHSTRFLWRAIRDGDLDTPLTAIDPAPRADISRLPIALERRALQDVDLALFDTLEAGDFLCVDSSHILMPGSDVDMVLNRILPHLPKGVLVFFHDIFLPDAYPDDWPWNAYNEHQGVAVLLQAGYRPVFSSHYALTRMNEALAASLVSRLPINQGARESGLWLIKETEPMT